MTEYGAPTGMTRARLMRGGGATLAAAVLTACALPGGTAADKPATKREITLTLWDEQARTTPIGGGRFTMLEERAAELRSTLGITVQQEVGNADKAIVAAAGGAPPHSAWIPWNDGARLLAPGVTVDPDEELKRVNQWTVQRRDIFPGILETSQWAGRLTAIPIDTSTHGIFFDRGVLTKAGVAPPTPNWTRDEFTQKVIRAAAPPDRWGFNFSNQFNVFMALYGGAGGKPITKDAWTIDNAVGRETLRYLHDLLYGRQVGPTPPPGELMRTGEGKVAFEMTGIFRLPTLRQAGVDAGGAPMPVNVTRFTMAGGFNLAIFKVPDGDAQHAAARLGVWLNAPDFQAPYTAKADITPVTKAAMAHKDYQAYLAKDPVVRIFAEQAPFAWRDPPFPSGRTAVRDAIAEYITKALRNEIAVNDALAQGQRAAQLLVDEDLRRYGK